MTEPVRLLERTLHQLYGVLDGIAPDQAHLPTPCESWDVRALVAHVIFGLDKNLARARGEQVDWSAPAPDPGADWLRAFRTRADQLLQSWRAAGDLDGTLDLPGLGTVPARFPLDQQVTELAVHTWDIARATGQQVGLDPEIGEHALGWARQALKPEFRGAGTAFGEEQPARPDAPAYDRLAAFFGRDM